MSDPSSSQLFGLSPARYGSVSLASAALAIAAWPLSVVIGFTMVYVSLLMALVAAGSGLLAVGVGIYFRAWRAVAAGLIGVGLVGSGAALVIQSLMHF
jgi:hypothetical protein